MREIHGLLHELYRDFPVFAPIDYAEFRAIFRGFRLVTDLSMVFIAHHDGHAVGFFVALPDYPASISTGSTLRRLLTVARHRRRSDRYVLAYLGAKPEYQGLGAAMTGILVREVQLRNAGAVGTLIHEGGPTTRWAPELVGARNTYVLLRKEL
jgi:GNAT superfamily N-acetyltransferase